MTFDFFNPSHLAFGSKLTKAFNQLNRLCNEAEDNLVDLFRIYDTYKQYVNRNYIAPFPTRPDAPVRVNELFDLINDGDVIKDIGFTDEGKLHCAINIFNPRTNRLTVAEGETDIKEGYAFARASISNQNPYREIQFVEDYFDGEGTLLFSFRIDSDNNINISEGAYNYFLPSNFDHITGISNETENIRPGYEAEDYEAIVLTGYARWGNNGEYTDGSPLSGKSCLKVSINGSLKVYNTGWQCRQYVVVYLKPGDKIDGNWVRGFKVKYTKKAVPVPRPSTTYPEWVDHVDLIRLEAWVPVVEKANVEVQSLFSETGGSFEIVTPGGIAYKRGYMVYPKKGYTIKSVTLEAEWAIIPPAETSLVDLSCWQSPPGEYVYSRGKLEGIKQGEKHIVTMDVDNPQDNINTILQFMVGSQTTYSNPYVIQSCRLLKVSADVEYTG